MEVTKLWDFLQSFEERFIASLMEFASFFLVSLFSCFDRFIGVFDYWVGRSMLSCNHGVHGQRRRAFSDSKLFFARSIQPNFSMGCIIGRIGNDLVWSTKLSLCEDLKGISSEEKLKEGQIDPWKNWADCEVIALRVFSHQGGNPLRVRDLEASLKSRTAYS